MNSSFLLRCSLSLLFVLLAFTDGVSQSSDCKEIKAKVLVTNASQGNDDGKVEVVVESGPQSVALHLLTPGKDPAKNLKSLTIDGLRKGNYVIVLADKRPESEYCPRAIKVTVK